MRFYALGLCLVSTAACGDGASRPASATDQADLKSYFAAKASYDSVGRRRGASFDTPYYQEAVADLGKRLRVIIRPDSVSDTTLTANIASLYEGDEDWGALDGLTARRGNGRVVITTPELLAAWARSRGDTTSPGTAALSTENMLTWAFQDGFHVFPFGDLKAHATFPPEVFLAWVIGEGNDDPEKPTQVLVGVDRGHHIYLVTAPMVRSLGAPAECGPFYRGEEHRACFGKHLAEHPDFPKIVDQARALARIPDR